MTGPQFAAAHGGDSSTWTTADFETELNLAEIDAHKAAKRRRAAAPIRAVIYLLHAAAFLTAGYATYQTTAPHLPVLPIVDANAAWFTGIATALAVCFGLDPLIGKLLRALHATPTDTQRAA